MVIKEIRIVTGLSGVAFSDKYNIPRRTLEDWENGRRKPPDYVLELLEFKVLSDLQNTSQ